MCFIDESNLKDRRLPPELAASWLDDLGINVDGVDVFWMVWHF